MPRQFSSDTLDHVDNGVIYICREGFSLFTFAHRPVVHGAMKSYDCYVDVMMINYMTVKHFFRR